MALVQPWYNTKDGITERYLSQGLRGLYDLQKDRHRAGYEWKQQLDSFVILGRWMTDTCGNFGKISENILAEQISPCPPVMTEEEAYKIVPRIVWGMRADIPPPGFSCEICGREFSMDDVHNIVEKDKTTHIELAPFLGIPLDAFRHMMETTKLYQHHLWGEFLRNPRFAAEENCRGWTDKEHLGPSYIISQGDEILVTTFYWQHVSCAKEKARQNERQEMEEIFKKARFFKPEFTEIPNQYFEEMCCNGTHPPWFRVRCIELGGDVIIGWRKRVIHIDWSECQFLKGVNFTGVFSKEDVTKGVSHIHAWGWDKAREYLEHLNNVAQAIAEDALTR